MCWFYTQAFCACCKKPMRMKYGHAQPFCPVSPPHMKPICPCKFAEIKILMKKICNMCEEECGFGHSNCCEEGILPNKVLYLRHSKKFVLIFDDEDLDGEGLNYWIHYATRNQHNEVLSFFYQDDDE